MLNIVCKNVKIKVLRPLKFGFYLIKIFMTTMLLKNFGLSFCIIIL